MKKRERKKRREEGKEGAISPFSSLSLREIFGVKKRVILSGGRWRSIIMPSVCE